MEPDFEEINYHRARKRVKEIKSFYINLACYCVVIPVLIFVNLMYTPEFWWFLFSMAGWGLGLLFHAMSAFNLVPFLNREWEERKLKEYMEEDRRRHERFNQN